MTHVNANKMASSLVVVLLWITGSVLGLRDLQLSVPEAVGVGTTAVLGCRWALDTGETLYTLKWYHGAQEFFRFVPKELPNTRVFSQTGVSVDISRSGSQQVVLRDATRGLSGRYRCEVSADAPFFHTVYKSSYMRVVDFPESGPKVLAQKSWYSVGDMLRANCTSPPADPPANITWLLNGHEVKGLDIPAHEAPFVRSKPPDTSLEDANRIIFSPWEAVSSYDVATDKIVDNPGNMAVGKDLETTSSAPQSRNISIEGKTNRTASFSQLVLRVQPGYFSKGRLNLTCVARVLSVWSASGVLLLDEERPQIAPVMGSRDSNSGHPSSTAHVGVLALFNCLLLRQWSIR